MSKTKDGSNFCDIAVPRILQLDGKRQISGLSLAPGGFRVLGRVRVRF